MRFFDTHCDTVMNAYDEEYKFITGDERGHIDLPRLRGVGHGAQVFAIFAPHSRYGDGRTELAGRAVDIILDWATASDGQMIVARTAADVARSFADPAAPLAALIGLEGADPLPEADALTGYFDRGLRLLIPAWDDNAYSGTATGGGGPLTGEGKRLVDLARSLRVMVDVSHLSDAAFAQVADLMGHRPFVASHSNCRSLSPAMRNLTDDQIRILAGRGGVMGINLAADFLDPDYFEAWEAIMAPVRQAPAAERSEYRKAASPKLAAILRPPLEIVSRHVLHAMKVGGEDCVGLGGDLDGITYMPEGLTGAESYPAIAEALAEGGLTERQVEKMCWRNMLRVFEEVLP